MTIRNLKTYPILYKGVARFFIKRIVPLYGDQTSALKKAKEGKDRTCLVLIQNKIPLGLVIFKKQLTNEYSNYGLNDCLEIKTLGLFDPENASGKGYGGMLLLQAAKEAVRLRAKGIFVSVSSGKPEAYYFFSKMGFEVVAKKEDLYKKGLTESYFLHKDPGELLLFLLSLNLREKKSSLLHLKKASRLRFLQAYSLS